MATAERNKRTRDECTRDECPVCMDCIGDAGGGTDGDRVLFPCGHFVCGSCNDGMLRRDDHRCPTCRTPRDGFTVEMADASAEQRLVQDMAEEGNPNAARMLAMRSFLVNDRRLAPVTPQDVAPMLRDLIGAITEATGRPMNRTVVFVGSNGNRVHVRQQTVVPRRSERLRDQQSVINPALSEEERDEQQQEQQEQREPAEDLEARMPQPLRDLLSALVSPVDLANFQEVRRRV